MHSMCNGMFYLNTRLKTLKLDGHFSSKSAYPVHLREDF